MHSAGRGFQKYVNPLSSTNWARDQAYRGTKLSTVLSIVNPVQGVVDGIGNGIDDARKGRWGSALLNFGLAGVDIATAGKGAMLRNAGKGLIEDASEQLVKDRLQAITNQAARKVARMGDDILTDAQARAVASNPNLRQAYMGWWVHKEANDLARADDLTRAWVGRINKGPDFINPAGSSGPLGWLDITTTKAQFDPKVPKYTPDFGVGSWLSSTLQ
jgi:hypothetical protein